MQMAESTKAALPRERSTVMEALSGLTKGNTAATTTRTSSRGTGYLNGLMAANI